MNGGLDNGLPSLEIEQDISALMSDDDGDMMDDTHAQATPESVAQVLKDIEIAEEDDSPFVKEEIKKVKPKRQISERQKAHLAKVNQIRRDNAAARREMKKEVDAKLKEAERKIKEEVKESKAKYKKLTQKVKVADPREVDVEDEKATPDDFVPTHKEERRVKEEAKAERDKWAFEDFMNNMEKYQRLRHEYESEKAKKKQSQPKPKPQPPVKKSVTPVNPLQVLPEPVSSPFDAYFG